MRRARSGVKRSAPAQRRQARSGIAPRGVRRFDRTGTLTLLGPVREDLRSRNATRREVTEMAHSTDRKKEQKKQPQKTAKEKKQEKRDKKK